MKINDYRVIVFGDDTYHICESETDHVICSLTFTEDKQIEVDLFMKIAHQIIVNYQGRELSADEARSINEQEHNGSSCVRRMLS